MKYKLIIGNDNRLFGVDGNEFEEGTVINFTVPLYQGSLTKVESNDIQRYLGIRQNQNTREYTFSMPSRDVVISVTTDSSLEKGMSVDTPFNPSTNNSPMMSMANPSLSMKPLSMESINVLSNSDSNPKIIKFCSGCGARLEKENQKFCQSCGKNLYE